jgi:hypothetical protein
MKHRLISMAVLLLLVAAGTLADTAGIMPVGAQGETPISAQIVAPRLPWVFRLWRETVGASSLRALPAKQSPFDRY